MLAAGKDKAKADSWAGPQGWSGGSLSVALRNRMIMSRQLSVCEPALSSSLQLLWQSSGKAEALKRLSMRLLGIFGFSCIFYFRIGLLELNKIKLCNCLKSVQHNFTNNSFLEKIHNKAATSNKPELLLCRLFLAMWAAWCGACWPVGWPTTLLLQHQKWSYILFFQAFY